MSPLTSTIRQAIALSGGEVEQTGGGCETLRLPWGKQFIRISSQEDTLMLPDTLDGEAVSVGVYFDEDEEEGLRDDLCCSFDSLREALLGTIAGIHLVHEEFHAAIKALPSDAPESDPELAALYAEEEALFTEAITDLLSDLRHFCDRQKLDFAAMDRAAYRHYIEEKGR